MPIRKIRKCISPLFTAVILICTGCAAVAAVAMPACAAGMTAYAHEVPDLTKEGTIRIVMKQGENVVPGGTLTLYRAGAVEEDDGNYSFQLTEDFIGSRESLNEISSSELAQRLSQYAKDHSVSGITQEIDGSGSIAFTGLAPGLYLLVQGQAAEGYQPAVPFLVSIPLMENGLYIYDVDASPKVELIREPGTDTPSVEPQQPADTRLPQTGQLNWPVPVLAALGLSLFTAGWLLRFGKKRDSYEK